MIVYFSETFLFTLIVAALVLISVAFLTLLFLLIKDLKRKEVW